MSLHGLSVSQEDREELRNLLSNSLRANLFSNRYVMNPARLEEIADEAANNIIGYLENERTKEVASFAERLAREGLSVDSLSTLPAAARRAFAKRIAAPDASTAFNETIDSYSAMIYRSYFSEREAQILVDQEQLRKALSATLESQGRELLIKNLAIDTTANGILIADLDGRVTYVNRAFLAMWGYESLNGLVGKRMDEIWPKDRVQRIFEGIDVRGEARGELEAKRGDGSDIIATFSTSRIQNDRGDAIGIMTSFLDVTETRLLEIQMQQLQKMEDLGQLAGGIVHDFNNLLAAMGGYLQLLLLDAPPGTRTHQDLMQIKIAVERGASLTRQLGYFTRQPTGKHRVMDLNDTVREAYELLQHTLPPEIRVRIQTSAELHRVEADPGQMRQAVMNLCVNAREAILERAAIEPTFSGVLTIETTNTHVSKDQARRHLNVTSGRYVLLQVRDNGIGIPEGMLRRLFMPFFSTKSAKQGTGLGLAAVYGIVRSHHGFVDVTSTKGSGTTFRVYLPVRETTDSVSEDESAASQLAPGTGTVLIVDDDAQVREVVSRALTRCGYRVVQAASGEEALEIYGEQGATIDLVILDMVMPGIGGRETLNRLRQIDAEVAVLILTGHTTGGRLPDQDGDDGTELLEKPVDLTLLSRRVKSLIEAPLEQ